MDMPTAVGSATTVSGAVGALRYHFSVDDVFDAFIEVSDRGLKLFDHPFFAFLKRIHDELETAVDVYLFHRKVVRGRWRTLKEVSESVGAGLRQNQWLRVGPHGLDYDTPPYAQTPDEQIRTLDAIYAELDRFAPDAARSSWVRLHYFSEAYEIASYLNARGVTALFATDKPAVSYRMPDSARQTLKERGHVHYGGMRVIRSHFRIETLVDAGLSPLAMMQAIDSVLSEHGLAVVMTHEYEVERPEVREMALPVLRHLTARGATSV